MGSYLDLPGVKPTSRVGTLRCTCGTMADVKVNRAGNLYYFCPNPECRDHKKCGSDSGNARMVGRMETFRPGLKKRMVALAKGGGESASAKREPKAEADAPAPETDPSLPEPAPQEMLKPETGYSVGFFT